MIFFKRMASVKVRILLFLFAWASLVLSVQAGLGSARIEPALANTTDWGTWKVEYVVGEEGMAAGGGVRISPAGGPSWVFNFAQTDKPAEPGYASASCSVPGVNVALENKRWTFLGFMPKQDLVATVDQPLKAGDKIVFVLGDRSQGSSGIKLNPVMVFDSVIETKVDLLGNGEFRPLPQSPLISVAGAKAIRLELSAPSTVQAGEPFDVSICAFDSRGDLATDFDGRIRVASDPEGLFAPVDVVLPKEGLAVTNIDLKAAASGVFRIKASADNPEVALQKTERDRFLAVVDEDTDADGFAPQLESVAISSDTAGIGNTLLLDCVWRNTGDRPALLDYAAILKLQGKDGQVAARWNIAPAVASYLWKPGEAVAIPLAVSVPDSLEEGRYLVRLELGVIAEKTPVLCRYNIARLDFKKGTPPFSPVASGESNPMVVGKDALPENLYWGDIHVHTMNSGDGRGSVEKAYWYAKEVLNHDFAAVSDHVNPGYPKVKWERNRRAVKHYYEPGEFATILGYEWSNEAHGDKNVYYRRDDQPIRVPEDQTPESLFEWLRKDQVECVVIPHHPSYPVGLRGMDWNRIDEEYVTLIEMCSNHGTAEYLGNPSPGGHNVPMGQSLPGGFWRDALDRGLKIGAIASSDQHYGYSSGKHLLAVWAPELTREAVIDALKARRCYGATRKIHLEFSVNGIPMGGTVRTDRPEISGRVIGTDAMEKIELVKNGETVFTWDGAEREHDIQWRDDAFEEVSAWYYLRVVQRDGGRAWSSPVWVESSRPICDPAIKSVSVSGDGRETVVVVNNTGDAPSPATTLKVWSDGKPWRVRDLTFPRYNEGICGSLLTHPGLQIWNVPIDETSMSVFLRWTGADAESMHEGEIKLHGVEAYHCVPFPNTPGIEIEQGSDSIRWKTTTDKGECRGLNLWVKIEEGASAFLDLDYLREGRKVPAEIYLPEPAGSVAALPFRYDLFERNTKTCLRSIAIPRLDAGQAHSVAVDFGPEAEPGNVVAELEIPTSVTERSARNNRKQRWSKIPSTGQACGAGCDGCR